MIKIGKSELYMHLLLLGVHFQAKVSDTNLNKQCECSIWYMHICHK